MSKPFQQRRHNVRKQLPGHSHLGGEVLEERLVLATLPTGFTETTLMGTLIRPTSMELAPDGRIFVTEQGGKLQVFKNGSLLATPFVSLTVDSSGERGLLGVTFDPDFVNNHFVYVYYTTTSGGAHDRVSRFTANGDVAVAGSELVLMNLDSLSGHTNHNGGAIHFGLDGKLYVAVGENANGTNSQILTNRLGKMLRINSDGTIPSDNPFGMAEGVNKAIWAIGLRNPFTFAVQPGTGRLFINDVGENTWEEINDGIAGSNYGWPTAEGVSNNVNFRNPLVVYPHVGGTSGGFAIAGGAFYNPAVNKFPADYAGDYFFGDYQNDWIRRYDPVSGTNTLFASGTADGLVDLKVDPSGKLYYLTGANSDAGALRLIDYKGVVNGQLFYNNSKFDGGSSTGAADDAAIATDKLPLQTSATATFANYSSYSRGINGLVIDLVAASHSPIVSDFVFRAGTTGAPTTWALAPAAISFTVRAGAGYLGADRVTITWDDGAIKNKWLYVQVRTTLGLAAAQVFYFGNAVGESGTTAGSTTVNATDEIGARQNPRNFLNPAAVNDPYDFNRDGYVNATDQILARSNSTTAATALPLIMPPAPVAEPFAPIDEVAVAVGLALANSAADETADSVAVATIWDDDSVAAARLAPAERRPASSIVQSTAALHDRLPRRTPGTGDDLELPLVDESLCEPLVSR